MHALSDRDRHVVVVFGAAEVLIAAIVVGAAVLVTIEWRYVGGVLAVGLLVAGVAALIDLRAARLPDALVVAAALPTIGLLAVTLDGSPTGVIAAVAGAAALGGPLFVVHLASPAGIGFGDVKYGAALGAAVGLVDPRLSILALCIASGLTAAIGLTLRRRELPLGPGLLAAVAGVLVSAAFLGMEPLPWR